MPLLSHFLLFRLYSRPTTARTKEKGECASLKTIVTRKKPGESPHDTGWGTTDVNGLKEEEGTAGCKCSFLSLKFIFCLSLPSTTTRCLRGIWPCTTEQFFACMKRFALHCATGDEERDAGRMRSVGSRSALADIMNLRNHIDTLVRSPMTCGRASALF